MPLREESNGGPPSPAAPWVGGTPILFIILAVFVATVIALAVEAGTSIAVLAAILVVAIAVTAVGLWGVSMAVKETVRHLPPVTESLTSEQSVAPRGQIGIRVTAPSLRLRAWTSPW